MIEEIPYKCSCGGELNRSTVEVEFFRIDFGLKDAEVCTLCGSEYLDQDTMKEIEPKLKKGIFSDWSERCLSQNPEILL